MTTTAVNQNTHFPVLTQQELVASDQKLLEACQRGFFYLEMSEECKKNLEQGTCFAETFPEKKVVLQNLENLKGFGGYNDRESSNQQIQSFYAMRQDWSRLIKEGIFSKEQVALTNEMHRIGLEVLTRVFTVLDVPKGKWDMLSGNLAKGEGCVHYSSNHYRPTIQNEGLVPHKDIGFITVLFINRAGLQGEDGGEWKDMSPLDGHFIVNFGQCLEMVTGRDALKAVNHRVQQVAEERISFGLFLDGDLEGPLYRLKDGEYEQASPTVKQFMDDCFKEAYSVEPV